MRIEKVVSATTADPGDRVRYTITVTNTGAAPYTAASPASFVDDLSAVLDDARFNGDATASRGTVRYRRPELSWSGPLPVGATARIRYSVTIDDPDNGDHVLRNTVVSRTPGSSCAPGDPVCRTRTTVRRPPPITQPPTTVSPPTTARPPGPIPVTGSDVGVLLGVGAILVLTGLALTRVRRRTP